MCYGYPVDLIAQWCCVDVQTARHYKAGTRRPGKASLTLFSLNRDGAILPAEWQGFSFRGATMWDPYGKPLTHGVLRSYQLALQIMGEWARGDSHRTRTLDEIFYASADARTALLPAIEQRSEARAGSEAKPSDLVRSVTPETVRRRIRSRPVHPRPRAFLDDGSTKVDGRSPQVSGNAKRHADPFAALSPRLRAAANAGAK
jgi:hypothetical protein